MRTTTAVRALVRVILMMLAALGVLGIAANRAAATPSDVPWAVETASNDFGSGRQNYSYTLNPGGQLEDGLVVVNHRATPLDLAVYAADAFTAADGQLDLLTKDAKSTRVGAWVHTDRQKVTVRPGESVTVPFTVSLPSGAAPGDYLGGVVTSLTQADAAGTSVERRLGIRIRLRVGGDLKPSLSVENLRMRYSGNADPFGTGDATVTYTIRNTGNAIVAARQTLSITGPFGITPARPGTIGDSPQLLPGDTWTVSVPVHGVTPSLRSTSTVTVVPLLTDASGSIAPLTAVATSAHAWTIPWTLLLIFVGVVCGLIVVAKAARRRLGQAKRRKHDHDAVDSSSREREITVR